MKLHGLAAPYMEIGESERGIESRSGWTRKRLLPGVFAESLVEHRDHFSLHVNHGDVLLARSGDRSLAVCEGADGLYFWADVRDREWIGILGHASRTGLLVGCSITWSSHGAIVDRDAASGIATFRKARLMGVSICLGRNNAPAFPRTWLEVVK